MLHTAGDAVYYPGLETHPQHEIARRQMRSYGGVLSFMLHGGFEEVENLMANLAQAMG